MMEHFDLSRKSRKSAWIRLHSAKSVIEKIDFEGTYRDGEEKENQKTIEYMRKYGVSKMRGGYYTNIDHILTIKNLKSHGFNVSIKNVEDK
jgi:hypothetical protein